MSERKCVLVAEDNDVNFQLVEVVLKPLDLRVVRATSGAQAIELAAINHPDLIYMDIRLPDMGLDAVRYIRADESTSHTPIIALSALAMVGDSNRAMNAGCDGYLSKPFSIRSLVEVTRQFVDPPPPGSSESIDPQ